MNFFFLAVCLLCFVSFLVIVIASLFILLFFCEGGMSRIAYMKCILYHLVSSYIIALSII